MTGDLIKRLSEQGEREDIGPDPWIPLGSVIPGFIGEALAIEPPLETEPPVAPNDDDAFIIKAARAARARGERIEFRETKLVNGGFEATVTLLREVGSQSYTVPRKRDVANGRRLALETLLKGDVEMK